MIPYDVVYYEPQSLAEAGEAFAQADAQGLGPAFLGGGTEIVTMARDGRIRPGALVDLKAVEACRGIEERGGELRFGCCVTLNEAAQQGRFPLLAAAASGVADHTVRNSITLGGNIAGRLPYREAVLPFLLAEATAEIAGVGGQREEPLAALFDRRLRLRRGELLVALRVSAASAALPHACIRRTRQTRVDYPLVTACVARCAGRLLIAVSGLGDYPARLPDQELPRGARRVEAAALVAGAGLTVRADMRGSAEYRLALLQLALDEAARQLGEAA